MWVGDDWVSDPIEDGLADCRNGHHGAGGRELAAYVDRFRRDAETLLLALKIHGIPPGTVWDAYWQLRYLLDGKAADGSDLPDTA